jgi:hypothetical protein
MAALALAGCAASPLQAVKNDVDARLTYSDYSARDFRPLTSGSGNCAVFAASYQAGAAQRGVAGELRTCLLRNGEGHAYFRAIDGEVLDVRQPQVGLERDVGCVKGSIRVVGGGVALR